MEFSTVQLGVDVATSLAILASAITFMVNQRLKARETKRRQLDESVRAVTVDEFQSALGELSGIYVKEIVERAIVLAELRTAKDLFDRLTAPTGRGSVATAPGPPQRVRASIPAGMAFVSLVGLRQDVQLPNGAHKYENAGRPIALASNFDISYTPARR